MSLTLLGTASLSAQERPNLTVEQYRQLLLLVQEGQDAKDSLAVYKALHYTADTLVKAQQKEIIRKEGVIVRTIEQRNNLSAQLEARNRQFEALRSVTINYEDELKKRVVSPKRWGIGPHVGYAAALNQKGGTGVVVGFSIQWSFIRW